MAVCIAVLIAFFVSPTVFGAEAERELFVNDVRVTEANAKDVLGDGTVRCSIGTAVLSLKGAGLRKLSVKGTWTLEVTGENTVREGMTVNGNLTVRGAGCLTVTGGLNLSEGSTILPASGMRVRAGNSQNGRDAFEIENPDKEVYESAYVRFEPDYQTVRYLPDGTCTGNEQSGKHYNGMPLILPDKVYFSREGYTQTGWRDAAGGRVYSLGDSVSEGAGTIYYPVWTVNRYTVTFRFGNGGEDLVLTVAYGAALEVPAEPVRIGYRFCGWNLPLPDTMPAQNLTRQALWSICDHSGNTTEPSCTTETVCSVCGAELGRIPHRAAEDDGDCTTPVTCEVCGAVLVKACGAHRLPAWKLLPDGRRFRACANSGCAYTESERIPPSESAEPPAAATSDSESKPESEEKSESEEKPESEENPESESKSEAESETDSAPSRAVQTHGCSSAVGISPVFVLAALVLFRRKKKSHCL